MTNIFPEQYPQRWTTINRVSTAQSSLRTNAICATYELFVLNNEVEQPTVLSYLVLLHGFPLRECLCLVEIGEHWPILRKGDFGEYSAKTVVVEA